MTTQIEATGNRMKELRADAEAIRKEARDYFKDGPRRIRMETAAAKMEAEANTIEAVLRERMHNATILQNAFNVAEMEFSTATEALKEVDADTSFRARHAERAKLEAEKAKQWAVMFALQEARNMITARGE